MRPARFVVGPFVSNAEARIGCNSPAQLAQSLLAEASGGQIRRLIGFSFTVDVTIQRFNDSTLQRPRGIVRSDLNSPGAEKSRLGAEIHFLWTS